MVPCRLVIFIGMLASVHGSPALVRKHSTIMRAVPSIVHEQISLNSGATDGKRSCPMPPDAKWCSVFNISGAEPFFMAVYAENDLVSEVICNTGRWEDLEIRSLGAPGHALDVGGNLGYYSFVLAHAGWNVTTFEPFARNVQLMHATMCRNPWMMAKIKIHNVGLGAHPDECQIISPVDNFGDGNTRCGEDALKPAPYNCKIRQSFHVARLDDLLSSEGVPNIDFLKIDVEGFECQVLAGGQSVLKFYKPRLIHTEVWWKMQGCEPGNYLQNIIKQGYKIADDEACIQPHVHVPSRGEILNTWACRKIENSSSLLQVASAPIPPSQKHRMLFRFDR